MTVYKEFHLSLSEGQQRKLHKALLHDTPCSIKLKHTQIGVGDGGLLLTNQQITKLNKRANLGKGVVLKLSVAQVIHNRQNGGDLLSGILGFLANHAVDLGKRALDFVVDKVTGSKRGAQKDMDANLYNWEGPNVTQQEAQSNWMKLPSKEQQRTIRKSPFMISARE